MWINVYVETSMRIRLCGYVYADTNVMRTLTVFTDDPAGISHKPCCG